MAYCGPRGIPLSVFLSWPEPDQQAALGWAAHEARRCGSCGTHPDDWAGDRGAFHPEVFQCPGCVQLERQREAPDVVNGARGLHLRLSAGTHKACARCNPPG